MSGIPSSTGLPASALGLVRGELAGTRTLCQYVREGKT
jgi:hypothetical protein